uniref:Cellulase n=1 Tax=uncultured bacterium contig00026 TaxID=1181515 RepID=A0A806KMQ2_9BACT|nr:cellulase [uncultured bacterium contig00026]
MKKLINFLTLVLLAFALTAVSCPTDIGDEAPGDAPALHALPGFGVGINIGNTLDSIGTNTWIAGETGWGNPMITRELIKALKAHGYKTIRLPVTWAENIGPAPKYVISEDWMDRVEEVVNWILAEDLYCILNLHHDGGTSDKSWILGMSTNESAVHIQFEIVWTQIAHRFRNASEKLILESMNEVGFDDIWNRWGGNQSQKRTAYRKLNLLNQAFVNTVRSTGAVNASRPLLIAGYWTDIDATCDPLFMMPQDTIENKLILSVHYYTPATFCIAEEPDNSWGFKSDWGSGASSDADRNELAAQFEKLKTNFLDEGIPVILGEYGVTKKNKVEEGRIRWMTAVTQICIDNGITPVLWDTGGEISRRPPYGMSDSLREVMAGLVY